MSLLPAFLSCQMGQHDPKRRYVRRDGANFVSHCRYCGKPIQRDAPKRWSEIGASEA